MSKPVKFGLALSGIALAGGGAVAVKELALDNSKATTAEQVENNLNNLTSETIQPADPTINIGEIPDSISYDPSGEAIRVFVYDTANLSGDQLYQAGVTPDMLEIGISSDIEFIRLWNSMKDSDVMLQAQASSDPDYIEYEKAYHMAIDRLSYSKLMLDKLREAGISDTAVPSVSDTHLSYTVTKSGLVKVVPLDLIDNASAEQCVLISDLAEQVDNPVSMSDVKANSDRIYQIGILRFAEHNGVSCKQAE